jgi:flagellar biosynthesis protein FlhF
MRVKRYSAASMPEIRALIRADLGPEAVILHTQKAEKNGALGKVLGRFQPQMLEVIAAVDTDAGDFSQPSAASDEAMMSMQRELEELKLAMSKMAGSQHNKIPVRVACLDHWYQRLLDKDIAASLAQQIIQGVADELSQWALESDSIVDEHVLWHIGRRLPPTLPSLLQPGQSQIVFLLGSTGVGKTTTIAKMAAYFAHVQRAKVLVVTVDTFRVAAIPQTVTYGEILGLPVEIAYSPQQLVAIIEAHQDNHLILIDTPGRSPTATLELQRLAEYVQAVPDKQVILTIDAGSKQADMERTVEAFSVMPLNALLFSKVDETSSLGAAYTLACNCGLSLSYLTTGQRVPEDIEMVSEERLVRLLVGMETVGHTNSDSALNRLNLESMGQQSEKTK